MADPIRFHLDEHMWPQVADALRLHGIDVTTTQEAGLLEKSDNEQIAYFCREGRVMVTRDADFLRFAATTAGHPGIVSCRRKGLTLSQTIQGLLLIHEILTDDEMKGHVEYL